LKFAVVCWIFDALHQFNLEVVEQRKLQNHVSRLRCANSVSWRSSLQRAAAVSS
jgi:hypothetical protein